MKIANYKLLAALSAVCLLSSPVSADWDDFGNENSRGFGSSTPQSFRQNNSFSNFSSQSFYNFDDPSIPESRGMGVDCMPGANSRWVGFLISTFGLSSSFGQIDIVEPTEEDDLIDCIF